MIRTWISLVPADRRRNVVAYAVLAIVSVAVRAVGTVLLVPLVGALFSDAPHRALGWLGWLTVATAAGWVIDFITARIGFDLGFAVLDHTQHDVADRLPDVRMEWFTSDNTATARQAIAATGPELVGLAVNLLTPLLTAVLLPAAIGVALLPVSWQLGLAALGGVPVMLGALWASARLARRADQVAAQANTALTERIIEFARTQQALRAARRVEPARSLVGDALAAQHGATMRLLGMQVPGQLLFSLASQLALILFAGATTALTLSGTLTVPESIALIVVIARYLEPFTSISELAPALESTRATLDGIRSVLNAPIMATGTATGPRHDAPRIEFDDVTFGYDGASAPVLDRVSFARPRNHDSDRRAVRLGQEHHPGVDRRAVSAHPGRVLVDGVDVASLDAEARRAATSVVFQHPYLFHGTIRENVAAGDPPPATISSPARWRWPGSTSSPAGCPPASRPSSAKPVRRCPG